MAIFKTKKKEDAESRGLPENIELIVHLKLLTVFALHEAEIRDRARAGLFDIEEITTDENTGEPFGLSKGQKYGDLHWRVYTLRAQERFGRWWKHLSDKYGDDTNEELVLIDMNAEPIQDLLLPPIDILMTWHAHMLNPRSYLTDCIRAKLSRLWCTRFPWQLVDRFITSNLRYECPKNYMSQWVADTSIPWSNEEDENLTMRKCRFCREDISIPISKAIKFRCDSWLRKKDKAKSPTSGENITGSGKKSTRTRISSSGSTASIIGKEYSNIEEKSGKSDSIDEGAKEDPWEDDDTLLEESPENVTENKQSENVFSGSIPVFCDKQAAFLCESCKKSNTHADFSLGRLIRDIESVSRKIPLLGATLKLDGTPYLQTNEPEFFEGALPALKDLDCSESSEKNFRKAVIKILRNTRVDKVPQPENSKSRGGVSAASLPINEPAERRMIIHRILCYYLDDLNSSDLSLCLYQAVVRQGSFTNKMNESAWLRSPKLKHLVPQCILRYGRFFTLVASQLPGTKNNACVPTLDIDLAWHTHQLSPQSYYTYAVRRTKLFIDHDDKISNIVLDSSFEDTAIRYIKRYNERYTMCYCSYCLQMQFSVVGKPAAKLIFGRDISRTPDKLTTEMSHVSAHNVVFIPAYKNLESQYSKTASFNTAPQNSFEAANYPYAPYVFNKIYELTPPCDRSGIVDPLHQKNCAACVGLGKIPYVPKPSRGVFTIKTNTSNRGVNRNGVVNHRDTQFQIAAISNDSSCHHHSSSSTTDSHCSDSNIQSSTSSSACGSNCGSSCGSNCGGGGGY